MSKFNWVYSPGLHDACMPIIIKREAIAAGARVRVAREFFPSSPVGWSRVFASIQDEHGNVQNVFKRALVKPDVDVTLVDCTLGQLVRLIRQDWPKPYFGAVPYLDAMSDMDNVTDNYGADSGPSIVRYFLANATIWRGDVARAVKAELQRRVKGIY